MDLKAITLKHPWAFAVARLDKRIENRTWKPPPSLIGRRIAIHGGAIPKGDSAFADTMFDVKVILRDIITAEYMSKLSTAQVNWIRARNCNVLRTWITPGIVATATLKSVVTTSDSPWFFGPYGWVLEDVEPLETPVPHRGAQGLWPVSEEALKLLTPERS